MPPRLRVCAQCLSRAPAAARPASLAPGLVATRHASMQAITPAPTPIHELAYTLHPVATTPATQPPSHRQPEIRRTQLHRQYTSLLRASPLLLLFQHNNLRAVEWAALRRELAAALAAADRAAAAATAAAAAPLAGATHLQVVRNGVFGAALRVVETTAADGDAAHPSASREARDAARAGPPPALQPLLLGPVAVLAFPAASPAHLKAALRVLAPKAPAFPAPTRRERPGYWEPATQTAVRKLLLLGARVEGRVLDGDATRWLGGIEGGLDGLRGQLVAMLQGVGGSLTATLEGVSRSLYFTVEARRMDLEEPQAEPQAEGKE